MIRTSVRVSRLCAPCAHTCVAVFCRSHNISILIAWDATTGLNKIHQSLLYHSSTVCIKHSQPLQRESGWSFFCCCCAYHILFRYNSNVCSLCCNHGSCIVMQSNICLHFSFIYCWQRCWMLAIFFSCCSMFLIVSTTTFNRRVSSLHMFKALISRLFLFFFFLLSSSIRFFHVTCAIFNVAFRVPAKSSGIE